MSYNTSVCTVSYEFLGGNRILKYSKYFTSIENRIPRVVEMMSTFIKNIVDSSEFRIKLSSVYLSGYSLGGHIAGMIGHKIKMNRDGQMVAAVWGN